MSSAKSILRVALAGCLALLSSTVLASGSGTIDDATLSVDYTGGPFVAPMPLTEVTGLAGMTPPCVFVNTESPTCDFYHLTLNLSDTLRNSADGAKARLDFALSFDTTGEYDFFVFDSAGKLIGEPEDHTTEPETLSLPLKTLPNGDYTIQIVPWFPVAQTFNLNIAATGTGKFAGKSAEGKLGSSFGGAINPLLLVSLFGLALTRLRRFRLRIR